MNEYRIRAVVNQDEATVVFWIERKSIDCGIDIYSEQWIQDACDPDWAWVDTFKSNKKAKEFITKLRTAECLAKAYNSNDIGTCIP